MFKINDDLSIYLTRGDTVSFKVTAKQGDVDYTFDDGDSIVFKVSAAKDANDVVLEVPVSATKGATFVTVDLKETDTLLGTDVISKPVEFWYEIALVNNKDGKAVRQTLVGYDDGGAKILKLLPEIGERQS